MDWVSNMLYFVDGIRAKIEVIRTDINYAGRMRKTVIGPDVLKKPRGIAIHPMRGYMFVFLLSNKNKIVRVNFLVSDLKFVI